MADNDRVYSYGGRTAHLKRESFEMLSNQSLCGREPEIGGWFGTGSQKEHDKAARLPLCKDCEKVLND